MDKGIAGSPSPSHATRYGGGTTGTTEQPRTGWHRERGRVGTWTQGHLYIGSFAAICGWGSALSESERRERNPHIEASPDGWHRCPRCRELEERLSIGGAL
jgi:hypothetical protein